MVNERDNGSILVPKCEITTETPNQTIPNKTEGEIVDALAVKRIQVIPKQLDRTKSSTTIDSFLPASVTIVWHLIITNKPFSVQFSMEVGENSFWVLAKS